MVLPGCAPSVVADGKAEACQAGQALLVALDGFADSGDAAAAAEVVARAEDLLATVDNAPEVRGAQVEQQLTEFLAGVDTQLREQAGAAFAWPPGVKPSPGPTLEVLPTESPTSEPTPTVDVGPLQEEAAGLQSDIEDALAKMGCEKTDLT